MRELQNEGRESDRRKAPAASGERIGDLELAASPERAHELRWNERREAIGDLESSGDFAAMARAAAGLMEDSAQWFGEYDIRTGIACLMAARAAQSSGRAAEAEGFCRRSLRIFGQQDEMDAPLAGVAKSDLGQALFAQNRLLEAGKCLKEACDVLERAASAEAEYRQDLARTLNWYGKVLEAQDKKADAEFVYRRAIVKFGGMTQANEEVAEIHESLGRMNLKRGVPLEAERQYRRALAIRESLADPRDPALACVRLQLSETVRTLGRIVEARELSDLAFASLQSLEGSHPELYGSALFNRAMLRAAAGDHAGAEAFFRVGLAIDSSLHGPDHPGVFDRWHNLAVSQAALGRFAEAEASFITAMRLFRTNGSAHDPALLTIQRELASMYMECGKPFKAEGLLRKAYLTAEPHYKADSPMMLGMLQALVTYSIANSNLNDADEANGRLLKIVGRFPAPFGMLHAAALENAGAIALARKDFESAENCLHRSVKITARTLGEQHVSTGRARRMLAQAYVGQELYELAQDELTRALAAYAACNAARTADAADVLLLRGRIAQECGEHAEAEALYEEGIAIYEEASRGEGTRIVPALNEFGTLCLQTGELYNDAGSYRRGFELFERARGILLAAGKTEHPALVAVLDNLSVACSALEMTGEAEEYRREAESIRIAINIRNDET